MIRRERVDAIVALTHLTFEQDRELAERFPEIDLIVGGHEHFPIAASVNRTFISKAGSDAKFVARIDLAKRPGRAVERYYELIPITSALPDDPRAAEVVNAWESKLGAGLDEADRERPRRRSRAPHRVCVPPRRTSATWSPTRCARPRAATSPS